MQDKQSVFFTRPAERQEEARGKVVIQRLIPPTFKLWPVRQISLFEKITTSDNCIPVCRDGSLRKHDVILQCDFSCATKEMNNP